MNGDAIFEMGDDNIVNVPSNKEYCGFISSNSQEPVRSFQGIQSVNHTADAGHAQQSAASELFNGNTHADNAVQHGTNGVIAPVYSNNLEVLSLPDRCTDPLPAGKSSNIQSNYIESTAPMGTAATRDVSRKKTFLHRLDILYYRTWCNVQQQSLPQNFFNYNRYTSKVTLPLCTSLGVLLILLGIAVFLMNRSVVEYTIKYARSDGPKSIMFTVAKLMPPPIFVYYDISNFYANTRLYIRDSPNYVFLDTSCLLDRTYNDSFSVRKINGVLTLPSLAKDVISGGTILPDLTTAYPCGLSSLSVFNDVFLLYDGNNRSNIYILSPPEQPWDVIQFMNTNKTFERLKPWAMTNTKRYRGWLHPSFTSSFRKLLGEIQQPLLPGKYEIKLVRNEWPAEEWLATKAITLSTLSAIGGNNPVLFYVLLATGCVLLIFSALLFAIKYFQIGWLGGSFYLTNFCELELD
ncbi:hypothetical protein IE077_003063 [Cardiosporidium cionae]|uniref:Uncharacterized protein n=1 Tax=Cardiosporidium cionae TaxID=476202 RepID=A0ABQ7JFN3_9APIC|nr:hypothetical protein IE077_003063 [Cardiosporidium cionae]|eukprot:KAF8822689.1 hypothetical protein IE077_003063 [Cardiosporidium cionae]